MVDESAGRCGSCQYRLWIDPHEGATNDCDICERCRTNGRRCQVCDGPLPYPLFSFEREREGARHIVDRVARNGYLTEVGRG